MACINRKPEDSKILINHAKLTEDELKSITQTLEFPHNFGEDTNQILIELDEKVLETIQEDQVVIRGDEEDMAVLCTRNKTFELREAETSNTLAILPGLKFPDELPDEGERVLNHLEVTNIHFTYFELRPCKPRLKKLQELLAEQPYSGTTDMETEERTEDGRKYTYDDLLEKVQASEDELNQALVDMEAYHIYGFWQILEFDYKFKVFSHIINLVDTQSWALDCISKDAVLRLLNNVEPRTIISQCFDFYLSSTNVENDNGEALYNFIDNKVCRLYAEVLLKPAEKFNLQEFLSIWQQSVPEGMTTNLSQLGGLALVDRLCTPEVICYFPAYDLPEDIQERFSFLFDAREKWTMDEIKYYVEDLAGDKVPVSAILTKYARASNQNGIKYFSAKHSR
ncbi:sister chromatid cohesion protein DCC1 isoform X2 [Oratosquilla oratoria]|uniref:sister chromatid cohesion protein DCC1 isoform X2 n=1 Tax=Oratosquilla oratoria TaxID=337810 RepID=UPI003F77036D